MNNRVLWSTVCVSLLVLVACSTGHCRRDGTHVPVKEDIERPTGYKAEKLGSIKIAKSDGSRQCERSPGYSLENMKKELGDINVISMEKLHDGLMRTQVCGASTGMMNVYEINHEDLVKAQKLGFTVFKQQ